MLHAGAGHRSRGGQCRVPCAGPQSPRPFLTAWAYRDAHRHMDVRGCGYPWLVQGQRGHTCVGVLTHGRVTTGGGRCGALLAPAKKEELLAKCMDSTLVFYLLCSPSSPFASRPP